VINNCLYDGAQIKYSYLRNNVLACIYYCVAVPGIVGEVDKEAKSFYMWTHKKLDIGYNQDAIVDVNLTSEAKVKLEPGARISFTYEVH